MAINSTPPDRTRTAGLRLVSALTQLENVNNAVQAEIATVMESIDGGEANATDVTKMAGVQSSYNFQSAGAPSNAAAVAAIAQLQAVRAVLTATGAQLALAQAFNRLRG